MLAAPPEDSRFARILRWVIAAWVALLVLTLFPYTSDPAAPIKNLITAYATLLMAALWLGAVLTGGQSIRVSSPTFLLLGAWLLVNLFAALLSPYPANSLNTLRPWITLSMLSVLAAQALRRKEDLSSIMTAVVGAVALSSLYGFCQAAGLDPFPWATKGIEEYHGLPSTYANPNFAGHALVLALIMGLGLLGFRLKSTLQTKRGRDVVMSLFLAAAVALMGLHLYFTHMRGGRVALLAAALLLVVYAVFRRRLSPLRAALCSCTAVVLLAAAGAGLLFAGARNVSKDPTVPVDSSLVLRLNGYYGACRMLLDHPVLGIGVGNYGIDNAPYWTAYEKRWYATEGKKNYHVHCDLLESGVDAGIPGAGLYLALLAWGVLAGLVWAGGGPDRKTGLVLAAAVAAFGADGLFGFNLRVPVSAGLFFLILGMLDGVTNMAPPVARRAAAVALAAVLAVAASLCALFETQAFLAERFYQRANGAQYWAADAAKKGDTRTETLRLKAGYALLDRARGFMPWDPRFPEAQGQIDLKLHRPDEAAERFQESLDRQPKHPGLLISLAQAKINLALRAAGEAQGKNPLEYPPFTGPLESAEQAARRAIELCEGLPEAYEAVGRAAFLRAVALEDQRRDAAAVWAEAEKELLLALRYGTPNRAAVQRMMAQIYVRTQQPDKAEDYFKQSAESNPADPETWRYFRNFAREAQRPKGCLDALSRNYGRVKEASPLSPEALALVAGHLAEMYAATGDAALAREVLRDALPRAPQQLALWGVYTRLQPAPERLESLHGLWSELTGQGGMDPKKAPPLLVQLAAAEPSKPESLMQASQVLADNVETRLKEVPQEAVISEFGWAAELLLPQADAIALQPATQGTMLANLGMVYAGFGRYDAADKLLLRAIPLLPEAQHAHALVRRSEVIARMNRVPEALALAQDAAQRAPGDPVVRLNLARRLAAAGRAAEAKFEYTSLLQQTPKNAPQFARMQAELQALEGKKAPR